MKRGIKFGDVWAGFVVLAGISSAAWAQPDPSGIEFVTVGAVNNPAYAGPDQNNRATGRGSVGYEYRIGKYELTTGQWAEFYSTFYGRVANLNLPVKWGAYDSGQATNRFRVRTPEAAMQPVSGPWWRTAAMFCNWLHNDKRSDLSAIANGAYDISTFGYVGNTFTDQVAHNPDAKYWIPTSDEWIKAAFYDPNYGGAGVGGWWWRNPAGSNDILVQGPPGQGQTNAGFDLPGQAQYQIPLGSYPDVRSPWGCLDMSGATSEFTETVRVVAGINYREIMGSYWSGANTGSDAIYRMAADFPHFPSTFNGFRIAAAVPSPGVSSLILVAAGAVCARRRR